MRILQVVALVTPRGDYGGPVRVALEQSRALAEAGHEVILAAGSWGYDEVPSEVSDVPVHLFGASTLPGVPGLMGLVAPGLAPWVWAHARQADIVHVHLGRDLVSLPAAGIARSRGVPYVVQTHGMVQPTHNPAAPLLDSVLTRRVLRDARAVFYLTEAERVGLLEVEPAAPLAPLRNGIALPPHPERPDTGPREVLFVARLQERKRPAEFVAMAQRLAPRYPDVTFRLVGPDEGEGQRVRDMIAAGAHSDRIRWDGPADREGTDAALAGADIYVLPSVDEPYPMTVLEAMGAGLPVVITDSCGLAPLVQSSDAGRVISPDAAALDDAVSGLLDDRGACLATGERARAAVRDELGMGGVVDQLVSTYAHN